VQRRGSAGKSSLPLAALVGFPDELTLRKVGDNVQVDIVLMRDIDGADVTPVVTSYYPLPKEEVGRFFAVMFQL
jgi:hypothetical protein